MPLALAQQAFRLKKKAGFPFGKPADMSYVITLAFVPKVLSYPGSRLFIYSYLPAFPAFYCQWLMFII